MKSWTAAAFVLAVAACTQPATAPQAPAPQQIPVEVPSGQYTLDPNHSTITVSARHFGLSNYVLRFNAVSGSLNFNADDPAQSSVEATIAITSLDTPFTGNRDFDAELQNSEWLDSASFPTATFRSTAVERTGPNTARVTGDLTLHGVTRPLTLDVTYNASHRQHPMGPQVSMIGFSGHGAIRRSDFGLRTLLPTAAGATDGVADDVNVQIETEFTRPIEGAPTTRQPAEPVN